MRHAAVDVLDQKAGVLLGLNGALFAVVVVSSSWWIVIAECLAVFVAAGYAFAALKARQYTGLDVGAMRDKYGARAEADTQLAVLNSVAAALASLRADEEVKVRMVGRSMAATVVALLVFATLTTVSGIQSSAGEVTYGQERGIHSTRDAVTGSDTQSAGSGHRTELHKGR